MLRYNRPPIVLYRGRGALALHLSSAAGSKATGACYDLWEEHHVFHPRIGREFSAQGRQDLFSGVVLITRGASRLYARAFGYAGRAWRVPNTLDTRFDTASITKLFTAIATLQLIDRGYRPSTRLLGLA
jgi:beta-lactamase family protein